MYMYMEKRIHYSRLADIMRQRRDGRPVEFSLRYCKKSTGELVTYHRCVLTSEYAKGATINVLADGEPQPKTLRRCLITHINGVRVYF